MAKYDVSYSIGAFPVVDSDWKKVTSALGEKANAVALQSAVIEYVKTLSKSYWLKENVTAANPGEAYDVGLAVIASDLENDGAGEDISIQPAGSSVWAVVGGSHVIVRHVLTDEDVLVKKVALVPVLGSSFTLNIQLLLRGRVEEK